MSEPPGRTTSRLAPAPAWTVLTDAPLRGLGLAREAGTILVWDEADGIYLLDTGGRHRSVSRAPSRVLAGAISDDGSLVALLGEGSRLWLLGPDFQMTVDRQGPPEASTLAIDPHGRYVAVASKLGLTQIYNRHGRPAGRFETRQPLAHLCFVPDRPLLLGAAAYGTLAAVALAATGNLGRLQAEVLWQESLMSNVGRLATSGDGGLVLASCFTHGVQRYDLRGQNEGSYHLGGSAAFAVPDFAGRTIGVATLEGELAVLSPGGNVRWKTGLIRPAIALETDPLGRFLIYGHATGEVVRLDLDGAERPAPASGTAAEPSRPGPSRSGSLRKPDWTAEAVATEDQAETAVLTVLDDPPRIGLISATNRLRIFTAGGRDLGKAPEILGVGRIARTAPGWIAAATDRQIVLYDARRNSAQRIDLSLVEITHLAIHPDSFGLAIVQERDRLGRATPAGRWIWKRSLKSPAEDLAIGPDGVLALTDRRRPARSPGRLRRDHRRLPLRALRAPAPDRGPRSLARSRRLVDPGTTRPGAPRPRPRGAGRLGIALALGRLATPSPGDHRPGRRPRWPHPGLRRRGESAREGAGLDRVEGPVRSHALGRGLARRTPGGPPDLLRPRRPREVAGRRRRPARPARRRPDRRRRHHRALAGLVFRRRGRRMIRENRGRYVPG